jgi:hypothetical protein
MEEYREKAAEESSQTDSDSAGTTKDTPMYMTLAHQYGIADEMEIGESSETTQSIEQEYQAYITSPLSPKNVDILKFWEVCGTINGA